MTEVRTREVPITAAILAAVREGIESIVRDALEETERLRERAAETLQQYDGITSELARLRAEIFGLRKDLEGIPDRLAKARLDSLIPDDGGEDPALLGRLSGVASVGAAFAPP